MADEPSEFRRLLLDAAAGANEAVEVLLTRYGPHVLTAVRRRLNRDMRRRFDSADFAQAVWASFFGDLRGLAALESPAELIAYLAIIARNKVIDTFRREKLTQKRSAGNELSLEESAMGANPKSPTPSQVAIANERWEALIRKLPLQHQRILFLRISGYTQEEIAEELGISSRTVRRLLKLLDEPSMEIDDRR